MRKLKVFKSVAGLVAILGTLALSGCVKNKVLVRVKPDGSGNIIISRVFSAEMVQMMEAQMKAMKEQMAGTGMSMEMGMPEDPFFNEDQIKAEAGQYGPGVTFVKAKRYDKGGARGSIALYSFKNVDDIFVNAESLGPEADVAMSMGDDDEMEIAERSDSAFEFKLTKGTNAKLEITVPAMEPAEAADDDDVAEEDDDEGEMDMEIVEMDASGGAMMPGPMDGAGGDPGMQAMLGGGNPFGFSGGESEEEMMQKMFKGMRMTLELEVIGTGVSSDASHPVKDKANRYTLLDMDMEKVLSSKQGKKLVDPSSMMGMDGEGDFLNSMMGMPGMVVETKPTVTIEFK